MLKCWAGSDSLVLLTERSTAVKSFSLCFLVILSCMAFILQLPYCSWSKPLSPQSLPDTVQVVLCPDTMLLMYQVWYVHSILSTDKSCSRIKEESPAGEPKHIKSVNRIRACPYIRESGKSSKNHKAQPGGVWKEFLFPPCPSASLTGRESLF